MKTVISASRRTDIPAFYLDRLIEGAARGFMEVRNPVSGVPSRVSLARDEVHTIVLWSKDFGRFLGRRDELSGYHLYFQFTINDCPLLEPGVAPLDERLDQLKRLAAIYGAQRINWRFDPVVFWDRGGKSNLGGFDRILSAAAAAGVTLCTFSFAAYYGKVKRRMAAAGFDWFDPPEEARQETVSMLAKRAAAAGVALASCSMPSSWPAVGKGRCIDGSLLGRLAGEPADARKDPGQRKDCGCTLSREVGEYDGMPCRGGCLYCYARPAAESIGRTE